MATKTPPAKLRKLRKSPTQTLRLRRHRGGKNSDEQHVPAESPNKGAGKWSRWGINGLKGSHESKESPELKSPRLLPQGDYEDVDAYRAAREEVLKYEGYQSFEHSCRERASMWERRANAILLEMRERDIKEVYEAAEARRGYGGQLHKRFFGDHFLSNLDLIERTKVYQIVQRMPKGAHLHIHFNANLLPKVLINIAKDMEHMYITSDIPLAPGGDSDAFDRCKIQFSIMSADAVAKQGGEGSIFTEGYKDRQPMRFREFRQGFEHHYKMASLKLGSSCNPAVDDEPRIEDVDAWLSYKLVFHEEEAHNFLQTADGAWEKFNGRTQMMKGLFNYETAYKKYTKLCMQEFVDDNIQYAEIRPNFMSTNQVWKDDGSERICNRGIVNLITTAYNEFQKEHNGEVLKGLKIIYCTPRSFSPEQVKVALDECLQFKLDKRYSQWIAGFDLVGEESKGRPLKDFIAEFLDFKKACKESDIDIPFLFHCGETLDTGSDVDRNLVDALLLNSKRIGHGFALPRHPYILEQMKERNICVEVCPISNEILGLTPRMNGHVVYNLLARNVHCTISTDNGTLFRSRLSHDFYQVLAGKQDMTLYGLRQLAEWSIEHSCLEAKEKSKVKEAWVDMWDEFCQWVVTKYGPLVDETPTKLEL